MKIGFAGTSKIATPFLQSLTQEFDIGLILTKHEKTKKHDSVYDFLISADSIFKYTKILTPRKVSELDENIFKNLDAMVVISYGYKIPVRMLNSCLWINIHASLLPLWRGPAPINYALMNGDKITGLTAMRMSEGIDEGDVYSKIEIGIDPEDNVASLTSKMTTVGPLWFNGVLNEILRKGLKPAPQDGSKATFTAMIDENHRIIDWHKSAQEICNQIRGLAPDICCVFNFKGQYIKVLEAKEVVGQMSDAPGKLIEDKNKIMIHAGHNVVRITRLIPSGGKPMTDEAFLRGFRG